jgi:hypothetical protein
MGDLVEVGDEDDDDELMGDEDDDEMEDMFEHDEDEMGVHGEEHDMNDVTGDDEGFNLEEDDDDDEVIDVMRNRNPHLGDPEGDEEGDEGEGEEDGEEGAEELEEEDFNGGGQFPPELRRMVSGRHGASGPAGLGGHLIRLGQGQGRVASQLMGMMGYMGRGGMNGADLIENDDGALQMRIAGSDGPPMRIEVLNMLGGQRDGGGGGARRRVPSRSFLSDMLPPGAISMGGERDPQRSISAAYSIMGGRPNRIVSGYSGAGVGASSPHPVTHPLLRASDPGQARQLQSATTGRGGQAGLNSGDIFSAIFNAIRYICIYIYIYIYVCIYIYIYVHVYM